MYLSCVFQLGCCVRVESVGWTIRIQMQINSKYEILEKVGNGNFSTVYTARQHHSSQITALKVMKTHQNIALKQAYLLKTFEHPNIVKVFDFQQDLSSGQTRMALEYLPQNTLELYEEQRYGLRQEQVKCILFQTALGLAYIHQRGIIHRDVKPQNILIDKTSAEIKLIDFGLAIPTHKISTDYVATRWYRAPENLLGTKEYTPAIDVFSLACVAVQLYLGAPLFPGAENIDQLHKIFNILGEPKEEDWPLGYRKCLELGLRVGDKKPALGLQSVLGSGSESFMNLMSLMLALNPSKRIASRDLIHHNYFKDVKMIVPPHIYKRFEKDHLKKAKSKPNLENADSHQKIERKVSVNKEVSNPTTKVQSNFQKDSITLVQSPRKITDNQQKINDEKSRMVKRNCKEPEVTLPNHNSLTFRGFHPIKTNKISVREVQKQAENTSKNKPIQQRDSRNNSIDSAKINAAKNCSNSIDITRKIVKKNIGEPLYVMQRRLTSDGRDFRTPQIKTRSNDKAKNIYFHSPNMLAHTPLKPTLYKPMKEFLMQSISTIEPQTFNYNNISPNQSVRMVRNHSEINAPTHRRLVPDMKPTFVAREREKTSVSPGTISIQSPQKPIFKQLQNPVHSQKETIYTMPIDPQKPKPPISLANHFFKKQRQDTSFDRQDPNISFNENRGKQLMNTVQLQRNLQKFKEPSKQEFFPFHPPTRIPNHLEPKLQQKIKIVKSLQHRQMADISKFRTNGPPNGRQNGEQRPSIMVIEKKEYREPRIITNKYLQNERGGQNVSAVNEHFQRQTDRNISINLNLSIIERQKSKDSSIIRERRGRI